MRFISHRGNISGSKPERENSPEYIQQALNLGLDVEVDVWLIDNKVFLGHDEPQYQIDLGYLKNKKFWCHAKNPEALDIMLNNKIHCFWHDQDKFTLTSNGIPWCYPNNYVRAGVAVLQDTTLNCESFACSEMARGLFGVCSDHIYNND